jgi:hypothetical protein
LVAQHEKVGILPKHHIYDIAFIEKKNEKKCVINKGENYVIGLKSILSLELYARLRNQPTR